MFHPLAWTAERSNVCKNLETFKELIGVYSRQIDLRLSAKEVRVSFRKVESEMLLRKIGFL